MKTQGSVRRKSLTESFSTEVSGLGYQLLLKSTLKMRQLLGGALKSTESHSVELSE